MIKITLDNSPYLFLRNPKDSSVNTLPQKPYIATGHVTLTYCLRGSQQHRRSRYRSSKYSNVTVVHLDLRDSFKFHSASISVMTTIPVCFQKLVCPVAHEFYQGKSADSVQNYQRILLGRRLWIPKVKIFYHACRAKLHYLLPVKCSVLHNTSYLIYTYLCIFQNYSYCS